MTLTVLMAVALFVAVVGMVMVARSPDGKQPTGQRVINAKPARVVTQREEPLWQLLTNLCPALDLVCMPQVHFGAFLDAGRGYRISSKLNKRADFLICSTDLMPLAVIELDDSTHKGREKRDAERDRLVGSAGVRVIRYPQVPARLVLARDLLDLRPRPPEPRRPARLDPTEFRDAGYVNRNSSLLSRP